MRRLMGALGPWQDGTGPLVRRLALAVRRAVERGELPAGTRLPSERSVATALACSRGTVVAAYDALADGGVLERRRGSGTYVRLAAGHDGIRETVPTGLLSPAVAGPDPVLDLSLSSPADASHLPAIRATVADLIEGGVPAGYEPLGLLALRTRLVARMADVGLAVDPARVLVTAGAQQAISLAVGALTRPGDVVVVESPTYPGALSAIARHGARAVAVDTDEDGPVPSSLDHALSSTGAALTILVPTGHNPTGRIMPLARRVAVAAVLDRHRVPVVEDRTLAEIVLDADAVVPPALCSFLDPSTPALVVGSLSKLLWGGLRLGWITGPADLLTRIARQKAAADLATTTVTQVLAVRLLDAAGATYVPDWQAELRRRRDVLGDAMARALPWTWSPPASGMSLWARLPPEAADGDRFVATALRHGVAVAPGSAMGVGGDHADHVRVSFAAGTDSLRVGVDRLARAWTEHASASIAPGLAGAV